MNHHSRSYSEQPQMASAEAVTAAGATNDNGTTGPQPQSFIRIHSDSQQSLDQLFNPTQNIVPLRKRNLPLSFFNPSVKGELTEESNKSPTAQQHTNNFHSRSVSFDHQNQTRAQTGHPHPQRQNFHMRTHSTLAPMPRLVSNQSSHQSSLEYINQEPLQSQTALSSLESNINHHNQHHHHHEQHNHQQHQHHHQNMHHHSRSTSGWSSTGNSLDNLNSPSWATSQPSLNQDVPLQTSMTDVQPMQIVQTDNSQATMQHEPIITDHNQRHAFYNNASNASHATGMTTALQANHHTCPNHLHGRSMSFNQQPVGQIASANHGFHMRTHSIVAPMSNHMVSTGCQQQQQPHSNNMGQATSHHSLHRSSQELAYQSNGNINSSTATGWSSSGYSTDDMTAAGCTAPTQSWTPNNQTHTHQHHQHPQMHHHSQPVLHQQTANLVTNSKPMQLGNTMHHHPNQHQAMNHHLHHHHHHVPTQPQHQATHQTHQQLFYHA